MLKQKIVPPNITFSAFFNASKMFWGPIKGDFLICRTVVWTNRRTRLMLVGFHLICLLVRIGVFQIHFLLKQWKIWHHLFKKWRKVFLIWLNLLIRVFPKRPLISIWMFLKFWFVCIAFTSVAELGWIFVTADMLQESEKDLLIIRS